MVSLMIVVFFARTLEPYNYSEHAFIQSGLFYDRICSVGSYEMIVCPYTTQPYETYMTILAVLLTISTLAVLRKK
jgi:hypothetical protein